MISSSVSSWSRLRRFVRGGVSGFLIVPMVLPTACKRDDGEDASHALNAVYKSPPVTVEKSERPDIDVLVTKLVSERPAPYPNGFSPPHDVNFYGTPTVMEAIGDLMELDSSVFPVLVRHLKDDRYSYSVVDAAWLNYSVGNAILDVLAHGFVSPSLGYKVRETPEGSAGPPHFQIYLDEHGAEKWAEQAKLKSHLANQMDFLNWCMERERQHGFVDDAQEALIMRKYETNRQDLKKWNSD